MLLLPAPLARKRGVLVDEVLPEQPMRQWVLSFSIQQRFSVHHVVGDQGADAGHRPSRHCRELSEEKECLCSPGMSISAWDRLNLKAIR